MRPHKCVFPFGALLMAAFASKPACAEEHVQSKFFEANGPEEEQWIPQCSDRGLINSRPYRHPLLGAPISDDGRVAVVDTIETGNEQWRFGILHRRSIPESSGELESTFSGVVKLRRKYRRGYAVSPKKNVREGHKAHPRMRPDAEVRSQPKPPEMRPKPPHLAVVCGSTKNRVSALASSRRGSNILHVTIALRRPNGPTLTGALRRIIATERIETASDVHAAASAFRAKRIASISRAVDLVADAIVELRGKVRYRCRNTYCLVAEIPANAIERVASLPTVQRICEVEPLNPEAGAWDAEDRSEVMQVNQFLDDGFVGEQVPGTFRDDIWFAVIESKTYDDEHPAWGKNGVNWKRVASRFICNDGPGCKYITNFPAVANPNNLKERHPTQVAALIFADLTDGQDPNLQNMERHSGFARNALGRLFLAEDTAEWVESIDTIRGYAGPYEHVVNLSQGGTIACNGDETAAISANWLYEDGSLLIKSAGNKSFNKFNPDLCKATTPGAAIGCFTVGGVKSPSGIENMRSAGIWYEHSDVGSSVGGSENNLASGRGRTIIDLVAHAYVKFVPYPNSAYGSIVQGTSFAAPQVTGAAINFIDYFQDQHFNLEYEPGFLYVNLLLMGDRTACVDDEGECATGKLSSRFDRRFGAGRAKFRRFDGKGLDSPAHYGTGMIPCLEHGEAVELTIPDANSYAPMEQDVGYVKLVAWWYDRRHEDNGTVANVDLRLYEVDGGGQDIGTLVLSDDPYDNKERVYHDDVGGKRLVVEFEGIDMFPEEDSWVQENCANPGEVDVYFAYIAEDDSRNDGDGPAWDAESFVGVEPEGF